MFKILLLIGVLAGGAPCAEQRSDCPDVSEPKKAELLKYVRAKYKLLDQMPVSVTSSSRVADTCFYRLTFRGEIPSRAWERTLFLSPDGRYLATDLFDTVRDPLEEEREKMHSLTVSLSINRNSSSGPENAPVTIVEFADFECPFCQRFAGILSEVLSSEPGKVRVVFHHLPLSMHPWAQTAAEGAACGQLQNSQVFWALHDQLFREQDEIKAENVKTKLAETARSIPTLDFASFQSCMDNQMSFGLVKRDLDLAASNQINATPTVFINGRRFQGIRDAAQLRELITEAMKNATDSTPTNSFSAVRSGSATPLIRDEDGSTPR